VRYIAISYLQVVGRFKTCGLNLGFVGWLLHGLGTSAVSLLGQTTFTLFTAKHLHKQSVCPNKSYDQALRVTLSQSLFSFLFEKLGIAEILILFWILSQLKLVNSAIRLCPWRENTINYKVHNQECGKYTNVFDEQLYPDTLLHALADPTGMAAISNTVVGYRGGSMKHRMDAGYPRWALCDFHSLCRRLSSRMLFMGVFKTALPVNMQVTLLALQRATSPESPVNAQQVCFILISIVSSLAVMVNIVEVEQEYAVAAPYILGIDNSLFLGTYAETTPVIAENAYDLEATMDIKVVWRNMYYFRLAYILYLSAMFYAMVKFVMVFNCPDALWNIGSGCVQLH
jgi:hypothetical protein